MSEFALRVEQLAKSYTISHVAKRSDSLREAVTDAVRGLFRRDPEGPTGSETFWALHDITFDVRPGEVVGIVGHNGAGKSTLLKILSRITRPTRGRAIANGRMASLLEVGTGFHPELTGRENIYLNGAVLGMRKWEIERRFDEIVAFSGVEKFLDTPVKRYSSGMYVRLAFAVAAHLEPDILILDEVLAVGDASFQKRCMQKMEAVKRDGRTILFVSHSMPSVTRLCPRTILLNGGRVVADGPTSDVLLGYLGDSTKANYAREFPDPESAPGNEVARLRAVRLESDGVKKLDSIDITSNIDIHIEYEVLEDGHLLCPNVHFYREEGACAFITTSALDPDWRNRTKTPGRYSSTVRIPGNFLAEGLYMLGVALSTIETPTRVHFFERDILVVKIHDEMRGDSVRGSFVGNMPGVVRPQLAWRTQSSETAAIGSSER
jgi:lipopolysaccharide transport system ATP-binding protein